MMRGLGGWGRGKIMLLSEREIVGVRELMGDEREGEREREREQK